MPVRERGGCGGWGGRRSTSGVVSQKLFILFLRQSLIWYLWISLGWQAAKPRSSGYCLPSIGITNGLACPAFAVGVGYRTQVLLAYIGSTS